MVLMGWLVVSTVVAVLLSSRPTALAAFGLIAWIALPSVASNAIIGGALGLHAGTWTIAIALVVLAMKDGRAFGHVISRSLGPLQLFIGLVVFGLLVTLSMRGAGSTVAFVNVFGGGVLAYALVRCAIFARPDGRTRVIMTIIALGICESAFAVLQAASGSALLFVEQRQQFYWSGEGPLVRAMGTLDSPLDLALLLALAVPLCAQIERLPVRLLAVAGLLTGMALTQSRIGAAIAAVGVVYLLIRSEMGPFQRYASAIAVAAGGAAFILIPSPLTSGLWERIEGSSGSTAARQQAAQVFLESLPGHSLIGEGFGSSGVFRERGVLATSLENGFFMFAHDFGLPAVFVLAGLVTWIVGSGIAARAPVGVIPSAVAALIAVASYSSIGTQSAASVLLFSVLALIPLRRDDVAFATAVPSAASRAHSPRSLRLTR